MWYRASMVIENGLHNSHRSMTADCLFLSLRWMNEQTRQFDKFDEHKQCSTSSGLIAYHLNVIWPMIEAIYAKFTLWIFPFSIETSTQHMTVWRKNKEIEKQNKEEIKSINKNTVDHKRCVSFFLYFLFSRNSLI